MHARTHKPTRTHVHTHTHARMHVHTSAGSVTCTRIFTPVTVGAYMCNTVNYGFQKRDRLHLDTKTLAIRSLSIYRPNDGLLHSNQTGTMLNNLNRELKARHFQSTIFVFLRDELVTSLSILTTSSHVVITRTWPHVQVHTCTCMLVYIAGKTIPGSACLRHQE